MSITFEKALETFRKHKQCIGTSDSECCSVASCANCIYNVTDEEFDDAEDLVIELLEEKIRETNGDEDAER